MPRPQPPPGPLAPRPGPEPPPGFSVDLNPPPDHPPSFLVGKKIQYYWPREGWRLGSVARLCTKPPFSHVVAHRALGSTLMFGSPHHHNTTSKVERVNGVIEDTTHTPLPSSGPL